MTTIKAVQSVKMNSDSVRRCRNALVVVAKYIKVILQWVPGAIARKIIF